MKRPEDDVPDVRRDRGSSLPAGAVCAADQALPITIRTRPFRLADVEILAARRDAFTQRFIAHPERIDILATILQARDDETRRRFHTRAGLIAYLRSLLLA